MKELEHTRCEVRKIVELQIANWYSKNIIPDDSKSVLNSPISKRLANFMGGFLNGVRYAWLSCGSKLVVFNTKTGVSISTWTFRNRISCLAQFPAQHGKIPLLLVGLDNDANKIKESNGMVCMFDCTTSQVLRAIRMPAGVEELCIISGGSDEEINDKREDDILIGNHGTACIALRNLSHYVMDLKRNSWENLMSLPLIDEGNPAEIDIPDTKNTTSRYKSISEKHAVHNLMNTRLERYIEFDRDEFESSTLYQEKLTTSLICSRKIGCLISGCLGRIIIWQNDGVVRWISSPMDDNMIVSHLALLEPTDDPRPFCYLWVAYHEEEPSKNVQPILRMYAMLFERKYSDKGMSLYLNLEGEPSLKFELEMEGKNRITNLCPIVRENNQDQTESGYKKGEDNLLLINVEGKTILFDLNQWYKEQMPRYIGECQNVNAILSSYQSESGLPLKDIIVSCAYVSSSLKEFSNTAFNTPEELFFPNSLSLEWIELGTKRLTFWMTRGVQTQLLREMTMTGPIIMIQPSETFHRCIATGLIPFSPEMSYDENNVESQRDTLLTLCLEQKWIVFLLRCAKEWSDGSAAYLYPAFLRWAMQRASTIQLTAHQLCIPLFDQSGSSIGETEVRTLRFFSQQMDCLCNVIEKLPIETNDLDKQRRTIRRISTYLQILLWFYDVGLLPETQDIDEKSLPISFILKIPYPAKKLRSIYKDKRKQYRRNEAEKEENEAVLFIDELITRECHAVKSQWEQESSETNDDGHYPPPSLQSLLRTCLINCYQVDSNEIENKHQIIIYLLMDLVMLLQGSCPGVDQLIKYPSAFKLSPSLIKLTQALWLLDHEDYQGFLDIMTGQLVSESDIKDWHHKLVMRTLLRNNQNKLALIYIRVRKPPLSSINDQGIVICLSVEHGLVQSAFHHRPPSHYSRLLKKFFYACKAHGRLTDILHLLLDNDEEEAFVQFLREEKCEETRLIYYLQHSRYNEANNSLQSDSSILSLKKGNKPTSLSMFQAYSATLPNITRRFSTNLIRQNIDFDTESHHPQPMSQYKSRIGAGDICDTVIRKAKETFIRADRSKIPFISPPCSSLNTNFDSNKSNCVLFVERIRKPGSKRTLKEMNDGDMMKEDVAVAKKRQKVCEYNDEFDITTGEISIGMMFGTPLVKRKNQITNVPDTRLETPHSILKIRQMIHNSNSSPDKVQSNKDEKISDKEKKRRQIRFSINQQKIGESSIEEIPIDAELIDEETTRLDKTKSLKSLKFTSNYSEDQEDEYLSPNADIKLLSESTVLNESSFYHSKNISGPRPRPGLRRNNIDSPFDSLNKSLFQGSTLHIDSCSNSAKTSADISITSDIVSSTLIHDAYTPKRPQCRSSLVSTSIYASTVLSSDTDVELSPFDVPHKNKESVSCVLELDSFEATAVESSHKHDSKQEVNLHGDIMKHPNLKTNFPDRKIYTKKRITNVKDQEENYSINAENKLENRNLAPPLEILAKHNEAEFYYEHIEDNQPDNIPHIFHTFKDKSEKTNCVTNDDTKSNDLSDNCDDELLPLKYNEEEHDDDDIFKSLSNSVESKNNQLGKLYHKLTAQNDSLKKIAIERFNDEYNITDDESSRSINKNDSVNISNQKPEMKVAMSKTTKRSDIDITDDKFNDNLDSSNFLIDYDTDRNIDEGLKTMTMKDITPDDTDNQISMRIERKESAESPITEIKFQTSFSSTKPTFEIISTEKGETSTSVRMTRSRRASSVAPIMQQSLVKTQEIPIIGRTRRATSLAKESHSTPIMVFHTKSSESEYSVENPMVKIGTAQQSTSSMRGIPMTSTAIESSLSSMNESPMRRSTRHMAPIQMDRVIEQTENSISVQNIAIITENSTNELQPVMKVRDKGAMFSNECVNEKARKTCETSVLEDMDHSKISNFEIKRTRMMSVSAKIDRNGAEEGLLLVRKTRAKLAFEGSIDKTIEPMKSKRTRAAVPVTEDIVEETLCKNVSKNVALISCKKTTSISKKNSEKLVSKRKRATSLTSDVMMESSSRRTRATSLTKDIENNSEIPKRLTRASSLTKEISVDNESINKCTRRKASIFKDAISDLLITKKGSIVKDIIPEEDDDELIFTNKHDHMTNREIGSISENHCNVLKACAIPIVPIPQDEDEAFKMKEKKGVKSSSRNRRATSVDLPPMEVKRRTRGSVKSMSNDDHNGAEHSTEFDNKKKSTRKTTVRRKTRAVSETKELKNLSTVERAKRNVE